MAKNTRAKVVLIGDPFVGKTSLVRRFVTGDFMEHYSVSIGGAFMARTLRDPPLKMQLWDTAGMERYRSMLPHFLRDATCAIIVFDLSERRTFLSIRDFWVDYVTEHSTEDSLVKVMVGNKVDRELRQVKESDARGLAEHYGMLYFETSAKTPTNVSDLFSTTARQIINAQSHKPIPPPEVTNYTVTNLAVQKKKFKCCPLS